MGPLRRLPDLSPGDWKHPQRSAEREALARLAAVLEASGRLHRARSASAQQRRDQVLEPCNQRLGGVKDWCSGFGPILESVLRSGFVEPTPCGLAPAVKGSAGPMFNPSHPTI
ncbi:MAG: hypothetical protein ACK6BG_00760 [Cyanobacteriota bacterium]